ncbi:uncharacterized protein LOC125039336 [Penaeus chinensis]|uniref:uncharacterized protein LOC125039336 n=1 Tax=Penaeus chinensis TaxID=139456 RepID=UPI001FB7C6A4|nr:uncharacterized protein LOC125039336 [Penaeus chinensis]
MKARGRLLLGLVALASSFQIQDDCLVKEHIEDSDVMFDTLEFLSLVEENSPAVDVLLTCQNAGPIYLLSIGLEHFLLKKSGQEKPVQEESWDQLTKTAGWRRFKLGLANKTMTLECDSKPLLQKAFELGCTVGGIKITKGRFTRKCSPGTPTWVVENDSELELPLVQMEKGVRESFTLFSLEPFTPSFSMKGAKVNLGFRGDSLVTSGDMKPLPAGPHDVSFQIFSEGNRTNLKVTKDGHIVQETALEDSPKCMEVSGDKKFVLVQKLGQTVPRNEHCNGPGEHCNGPEQILYLVTSLGISTFLFCALLFHHCRYRQSFKGGRGTAQGATPATDAGRSASTASGAYLVMLRPPPPPYAPPCPPASPAILPTQGMAPPEASYYEMYPTTATAVAPPPNSYALLEDAPMETVNDMYESAVGLSSHSSGLKHPLRRLLRTPPTGNVPTALDCNTAHGRFTSFIHKRTVIRALCQPQQYEDMVSKSK